MSAYTLIPEFLNGPSGRLFCLHYQPQQNRDASLPAILHLPALTEEMNKSRRMVALQARRFAADGHPVYVFDLHGTGDSEGELEDVTWESWQQDINFLCDHMQTQESKNIWLWGLRGGCLLAPSCLHHPNVIGSLFWQPIYDGQQIVSQLHRLQRIAARDQKSNGAIEVSGYTFSQQLLEALPKISLINSDNPGEKPMITINVSILQEKHDNERPNSSQDTVRQGDELHSSTVTGDPFWLTPEVALAPNLLTETCKLFKQAQIA